MALLSFGGMYLSENLGLVGVSHILSYIIIMLRFTNLFDYCLLVVSGRLRKAFSGVEILSLVMCTDISMADCGTDS